MKPLYSFAAAFSEALVSAKRRAKSLEMTSSIPTSSRIFHSVAVGGLFALALGSGFGHGLGELSLLLAQGRYLFTHARNSLSQGVNSGCQLVDLGGFLLTLQLVRLQLPIAPRLVLGLGRSFFLELRQQPLDHADDLIERVAGHLLNQGLQSRRAQDLRFLREELSHAVT